MAEPRLQKLRSTHIGPLSDNKGVRGKGHLIEKLMNKLKTPCGTSL